MITKDRKLREKPLKASHESRISILSVLAVLDMLEKNQKELQAQEEMKSLTMAGRRMNTLQTWHLQKHA